MTAGRLDPAEVSFQWNDRYVTGVGEVDDQHRTLVDLINRLGALLTGADGASAADVETVFGQLADYAVYHFREEEGLMHAAGIDARHVGQHREAHASFLDEVTRMHDGLLDGNQDAARLLLRFLTHWLAYHILGQDQVMARQMRAVASGATAEDAFLAAEKDHDPATEALLGALNGLFRQVSDRNRELVALNQTLEARVADRTRELSEANRRLEEMAMTDMLTGLPNRRQAMRRLEREWTEGGTLSCLMIDADGFKQINDTQGHDAGDVVLRELARAMAHEARTDDVVCRLGGDEFLVICPGTPLAGALTFAAHLHAAVARLRVAAGKGEWRGSISVGVAARMPAMGSPDLLLKAADDGVYAAKAAGRNCVRSTQPSPG